MNTQAFREELDRLKISIDELCRLTKIPQRTLYHYRDGTRRVPAYMPFLLKCIPLYLKMCGK